MKNIIIIALLVFVGIETFYYERSLSDHLRTLNRLGDAYDTLIVVRQRYDSVTRENIALNGGYYIHHNIFIAPDTIITVDDSPTTRIKYFNSSKNRGTSY